jgi:hypothetical protein
MRVYYVNGHANEVYYVRAEDEKAAEKVLRKEIGKYVFKSNLCDDETATVPEKLGDNIIVEFGISKRTLEADLRFDDITATAYVFSQNGMDQWKDWDITTADVIGDENVAAMLEETLKEAEESVLKDV